MKITVISLDNWGFNQKLVDVLNERGFEANHINFHHFKFEYKSILERIKNVILKTVFNKNLKKIYRANEIEKRLQTFDKQDIILTIKGDFISPEGIQSLKKYTKKSIAFFNDNISRYPRTVDVLPFFDEIYSFEKQDCEKFNLKFATNFIYNLAEKSEQNNFDLEVFNVTSKDKRSKIIIKIAEILKQQNISHKLLLFSKKEIQNESSIEIINKTIDLETVNQYIEKSKALIDIHRIGQNGLSFRVFECLGLHKKLITTNSDIANYDFYNPNNILVINPEKIEIPNSFFKTKYQEVSKEILYKYSINGWIDQILLKK
ncbi:hypothetical protein [Flavobacterium sp.]|uniref:hypothetical protein n=1 Tax=Flavobacterium sp. TaxID=239 RepID=UPI00286DD18E|nr:hypothetical protein [Flavobacterium sp.]